jgi:hypothetical protein
MVSDVAACATFSIYRWNTGKNWFGAPSDKITNAVEYALPNCRSR